MKRIIYIFMAVVITLFPVRENISADGQNAFENYDSEDILIPDSYNIVSGIYFDCGIEETGMDSWWPDNDTGRIVRNADWITFQTDNIADLKPGDVILWKDDAMDSWVNHLAIAVYVDPDGTYYTTADGNQYSNTGIDLVTRWSLNKSGSTFGKVVVWRNTACGEQIALWAELRSSEIIDQADMRFINSWGHFGWCYCYVVMLLSTVPEGNPGSEIADEFADGDNYSEVRIQGPYKKGTLFIVVETDQEAQEDKETSSPVYSEIYGFMITDEHGTGYAAWRSLLPEGLYSVRSGKYYYNTSWLIDHVEASNEAEVHTLYSISDYYLSRQFTP